MMGFGGGPVQTGSNPCLSQIMATNTGVSDLASANTSCTLEKVQDSIASGSSSSWADRSEKESAGMKFTQSHSNARFFVVKNLQGTFTQTSPFLIQKAVQSMVGDTKCVKKLRSGDLLIEVKDSQQAGNLIKCKHFGNIPVSVCIHGTLNSCRGVISEQDLLYVPEGEILENLYEQKVTGVRRISIHKDGKIVPTKHLILTFNTPMLPTTLKAGYLNCNVRPYIPNPLRCFQCQRFGHSKASCRGSITCARCGVVGHESESCSAPAHCVNCQKDHPAYVRSCEKWKLEKEIQTVRTKLNLSYPEARKNVLSRSPTVGVSYSSATSKNIYEAKKYQTTATQTDDSPRILNNTNDNKSSQKSLGKAATQTKKNSNVSFPSTQTNTSRQTSNTSNQRNDRLPPSKAIVQSLDQNKSQTKKTNIKPVEKHQKRAASQLSGKKKSPKINVKSCHTPTLNSFRKSNAKPNDPAITLFASDLSGEEEDDMSTTSESQDGISEVKI